MRWHGQSCPKIGPVHSSRVLLWSYHFFCLSLFDFCPEQVPIFYRSPTVQTKSKTNDVSRWYGQSWFEIWSTDDWCIYCESTMVLPELIRLSFWTIANILPPFDGSGKISDESCFAMMTWTILFRDPVNGRQHACYCETAIVQTNANLFLSQCLPVAGLIFGSSSTPSLSLTGPVLPHDLFYTCASPRYRGWLTSAKSRLRWLSKIGMRLVFLHF